MRSHGSNLCPTDTWLALDPLNRTEEYWMARADDRDFAAYCASILDGRVLWRRSDILVWFEIEFGATHPATAALREAGFSTPEQKTYRYRNYRKVKNVDH